MLIELPRECFGQEIVDAFMAVSKDKPEGKDEAGYWKGCRFIPLNDGVRYSPIKSGREVVKTGVELRWTTLQDIEQERRFWQIRPKVTKEWRSTFLQADISPVDLARAYSEIQVDLKNVPPNWHHEVIIELDGPFDKEAVKRWQVLICSVWETLSPGSTNTSPL